MCVHISNDTIIVHFSIKHYPWDWDGQHYAAITKVVQNMGENITISVNKDGCARVTLPSLANDLAKHRIWELLNQSPRDLEQFPSHIESDCFWIVHCSNETSLSSLLFERWAGCKEPFAPSCVTENCYWSYRTIPTKVKKWKLFSKSE